MGVTWDEATIHMHMIALTILYTTGVLGVWILKLTQIIDKEQVCKSARLNKMQVCKCAKLKKCKFTKLNFKKVRDGIWPFWATVISISNKKLHYRVHIMAELN
jgi:hypothetical protein